MLVLVLFAIGLASAIIGYLVADKRGANPAFWGAMAFMFGPFALPFLFLTRRKPHNDETDR